MTTDRGPALLADINTGVAGFWPRLALSIVGLVAVLAGMISCLGVIEMNSRVDDQHIAAGLGLAGLVWAGILIWLWRRYQRFGPFLRAGLYIVCIWAVTIPVAVLIGSISYRNELFVVAIVMLGFAATGLVIVAMVYRGVPGRPLATPGGEINVVCPTCGYSMVGLENCACPECGERFTIDQIIQAQRYDVIVREKKYRQAVAPESVPETPMVRATT